MLKIIFIALALVFAFVNGYADIIKMKPVSADSCNECQMQFISCFNGIVSTYSFCQCVLGNLVCDELNYCNNSEWNGALLTKYNAFNCEHINSTSTETTGLKHKFELLQIVIKIGRAHV